MTTPKGLKSGGVRLWKGVTEEHADLDSGQLALLEQACRQRDRADSLASQAAAGDPGSLRHERDSAMAMARLIAAMRLPDEKTGKRPMARSLRGAHQPKTASRDRLKAV